MFNMQKAKPISIPLATHFKISSTLSPLSDDGVNYMARVPYSSIVGSLTYTMIYYHPNPSHTIVLLADIYMANLVKEHWKAVQ